MVVKRIVSNIATDQVGDVKRFYEDVFGLDVAMDMGWIVTLASGNSAPVHISIASEGGSGTPVPDLSIEVDDVDAIYQKVKELGHPIEYEITDEPWGVRRFYTHDPTGKLLNVLAHSD